MYILLLSCCSVHARATCFRKLHALHELFPKNIDGWSTGLTERSRGFYRNSTPGSSNETINGEDGPAGMATPHNSISWFHS